MNYNEGYILGIDLGANSLGWAIFKALQYENGDIKPLTIEKTGVRVFEVGVANFENFSKEQGKGVQRRLAKQARRRLDRRARRKGDLFHILQKAGLMEKYKEEAAIPSDKQMTPSGLKRQRRAHLSELRNKILSSIDQRLLENWRKKLQSEGISTEELNTVQNKLFYIIRARALDEKIDLLDLGRIIYHLAQRRGFESNRKSAAKKGDDTKGLKGRMTWLEEEIKKTQSRTLGEYFARHVNPDNQKIRNDDSAGLPFHLPKRKLLKAELKQIWEKQKSYYPKILTDELFGEIDGPYQKEEKHQPIFSQRPLKPVEPGFCSYEPAFKRAPRACLENQEFRILQKLNDLEVYTPLGEYFRLSEKRDLYTKLRDALSCKERLTFDEIRKLLFGEKNSGHKFNLEKEGSKSLVGNRTAAKICSIISDNWTKLDEQNKLSMVSALIDIETEEELQEILQNNFGLEPETANKLAGLENALEQGYASLSKEAINKLLPEMRKGTPYGLANRIYEDKLYSGEAKPSLEALDILFPYINNPIVKRSLSELRKVINTIIREKDSTPLLIRIELARKLKQPRQEREIDIKKNDLNRELRQEANEIIAKNEEFKEFQIDNPKAREVERYLLWIEANKRCPYCGNNISGGSLFSEDIEVDHIIPRTRINDNSFANKIICHARCNRAKGDRTPSEAFSEKEMVNIQREIEQFTNLKTGAVPDRRGPGKIPVSARNLKSKQRRFALQGEKLEEFMKRFSANQLNDTAYASRIARKWLVTLYGDISKVQVGNGSITSKLRGMWGLSDLYRNWGGEKRDDHRHHAIDAVVIGLTSPTIVKRFNDWSKKDSVPRRKKDEPRVKPEIEKLFDQTEGSIKSIIVSHRVDRKVNGPLHKETLYSPPPKDSEGKAIKGKTFMRVKIADLSDSDIELIPDLPVREAVLDAAKLAGGVAKIKDNPPQLSGKTIKKVRIPVNKHVQTLSEGCRRRYVDTGSNHHIEIFKYKDKKGNEMWDGVVVSTLTAMKRLAAKQEVIQRNLGEDKEFKFSLGRNESVLIKDDSGNENLYIIQQIWQSKNIVLQLHSDARLDQAQKKGITNGTETSIRNITPNQLGKRGARKVVVTPLGEKRWAND